jgi:(1->4)-alpha-D-glucan 1-alpha-D-glucosylmutase
VRTPIATYRLQLTPDRGFDHARELVPYLAELGVSHLYLSPIAEAAEGSEHGYDVTDPSRVRAALGGEEALRRLAATAQEHGLGLLVDIVPNHVAADEANPWWWDVLANGRDAAHADHFDIDWNPPSGRFRGRLVLAVLDDHYGRVLARGDLRLEVHGNVPVVRHPGGRVPLSPETEAALSAQAVAGGGLQAVVDSVNADRAALHDLLEAQHHILMRWQRGADEIDYRRFFDQSHLVGVRVEDPVVFEDAHATFLRLHDEGLVDGFRIDHVDGLLDPTGYLTTLRSRAPRAWIVVEKILLGTETLTPWPIEGTTGYDALVQVNGLGIDPDGLRVLTEAWRDLTGEDRTAEEAGAACRQLVLETTLYAEVARCTSLFVRACEASLDHRDFTRRELAAALTAAAACTPTYRTYVSPGVPPAAADVEVVDAGLTEAAALDPAVDPDLWTFLRAILLGRVPGAGAELAGRFAQLTGPVAAKGDEDTLAYRWTALASAAEVGSEVGRPCRGPEDLHRWAQAAQASWPHALVSLTTHDTKRSEDVRARLAVLSQDPEPFVRFFTETDKRLDEGGADPALRWLLAQTAIAAWPIDADRLCAYAEKAAREAKVVTSWTSPDPDAEAGIAAYARALVTDPEVVSEIRRLVYRWADAFADQSLVQKALALTIPGVPDVYQGAELADLRLVDPDNRTPVDFDERRRLLREGGDPKLDLVRSVLALRRRHPAAFGAGPDGAHGPIPAPSDIVAFGRGDEVVLVATRFAAHRRTSRFDPDHPVVLPEGSWVDVLSGRRVEGGGTSVGAVLGDAAVVVLERI